MANKEQLEILYSGVELWNLWRLEHPHAVIDLSGTVFRSVNLDSANFENADLKDCDFSAINRLRQVNLKNSDLSRTKFRGNVCLHADGACMSHADLSNCTITSASFKDTDLSYVNFTGALLEYFELSEAKLEGAVFDNADLQRLYNAEKLIFDKNSIWRTRLPESVHSTPLQQLLQLYNPLWISFIFILSIAAYLPNIFNVLYWSATGTDKSIQGLFHSYRHEIVLREIVYYALDGDVNFNSDPRVSNQYEDRTAISVFLGKEIFFPMLVVLLMFVICNLLNAFVSNELIRVKSDLAINGITPSKKHLLFYWNIHQNFLGALRKVIIYLSFVGIVCFLFLEIDYPNLYP